MMGIIEALKKENLRISAWWGRWMYFEGSMWKVVDNTGPQRTLDILIETENEEEAIKVLLSDE